MIQRAEKELFGYFLEFGTSAQLDIAYSNSSKHSSRLSNGITHGLHMDDYNTVVQKFEFFFLL